MSGILISKCFQILCNGTGIGVSYNPDVAFEQRHTQRAFCAIAMLDADGVYVQDLEDDFYNLNLELCYDSSPSSIAGMFNTPMKPRLTGTDYSHMDYFLPMEIFEENITSDIGLLRVLHRLDKVVHQNYVGRIFLKVDVNIFPRFFKFALQRTDYSLHLRKRFGVYLSPWHAFKHALLVLFRSQANFIWLRLWKAAFPNDKTCLIEPSTYQLSTFFNICMVAYGEVYDKICTLEVHKDTTEEFNSLRNIFEFFLPAIRDYIYYLRKGDASGFLEQRKRLLVLFMAADPNSLYTNAEILSYLVNNYCSRNCEDYIRLFEGNLMLVNEEVGEISFSILARDEYKKGSKFKLERANRSYKLIPLMRNLTKFYRPKVNKKEKHRYKNPDLSSMQVQRCVNVFNCIIDDLGVGKWKQTFPVKSNYAYQMMNIGLREKRSIKPFPKTTPTLLMDEKLPKFLKRFKAKISEASEGLNLFLDEIY